MKINKNGINNLNKNSYLFQAAKIGKMIENNNINNHLETTILNKINTNKISILKQNVPFHFNKKRVPILVLILHRIPDSPI